MCFIPSHSISAGAHKRTKNPRTLDSTLRETFAAWYPGMAANDTPAAANAGMTTPGFCMHSVRSYVFQAR